jgi:phosphoserine phosphatase
MTAETVSSEELLRRLAPLVAAHGGPLHGGVVAFDADGTLWGGDVGEDYFFHFLEHASFHEVAARGVLELAKAHHIAPGVDAKATVRAIWDAYRKDQFPEDVVCELVTWCAAGRTRIEVEALARASVASDLAQRLRPELGAVLEWVRTKGVEAWVVSASPRFAVEAALAAVDGRLPFVAERVVAVEPQWVLSASGAGSGEGRVGDNGRDGEVMAADVRRPISYAEGKVTCLRAHIGARPLLAAFGDSGFDAALLGTATLGVAIRPKPGLLTAEVRGLLVLGESDFR